MQMQLHRAMNTRVAARQGAPEVSAPRTASVPEMDAEHLTLPLTHRHAAAIAARLHTQAIYRHRRWHVQRMATGVDRLDRELGPTLL